MCRLSAILAGGLVQKWIPLPPDSTKLNTSDSKSGRKSGELQSLHCANILLVDFSWS